MTASENTVWASDTPVSLPVPSKDPILVNFGAFGFTNFGLNHNVTKADLENYIPTFYPSPITDE